MLCYSHQPTPVCMVVRRRLSTGFSARGPLPSGMWRKRRLSTGCERVFRKEERRKGVRFLYNGTVRTNRRLRRKHTMNTETMLARILPAIEEVIKEVVRQMVASSAPATLYDLEEQTQAVLPRIGQVLLQGF